MKDAGLVWTATVRTGEGCDGRSHGDGHTEDRASSAVVAGSSDLRLADVVSVSEKQQQGGRPGLSSSLREGRYGSVDVDRRRLTHTTQGKQPRIPTQYNTSNPTESRLICVLAEAPVLGRQSSSGSGRGKQEQTPDRRGQGRGQRQEEEEEEEEEEGLDSVVGRHSSQARVLMCALPRGPVKMPITEPREKRGGKTTTTMLLKL
ncbi:hypothetical protein CKAH01_02175 [Colletotrichum kahawae]|uniref:Uncharacterized protein n=1 Tax=Colletotrichum kahawae TaxID=34407 RepID=A0AAD9Y217_COLKA|nr:hypothetical protein CKAH01_02175 [Colletotrichum kahawae]